MQEEPDPAKVAKGGAAKKPPVAPPKGAAGSKLEDIADNRARTVNYEKDFAADNNGVGLEVTEDVAIKFSEAILNLQVFDIDKETQDEILMETIQIDLSGLLYQQGALDMSWKFDKMQAQQLNYLHLTVKSEQALLSDFYRKKLNPM